ncbi:FAD-dependent monooxygenase [Nocardiopsis nanhaiensis]
MSTQTDTDVLVAGAGPAGLMLAIELHSRGANVTVVEAQPERSGFSRGFTLNSRSLDLLARRGLAEPFLAEGWRTPHAPFVSLPVTADLTGAATDHPFTLGIAQNRVEELLEQHLLASGATILRGHSLSDLSQGPDTVTAALDTPDGPHTLRAAYLAGCDGSRSTVRRRSGIDFPGTGASTYTLMGDLVLGEKEEIGFGVTEGPGGQLFAVPRPDHVRLAVEDPAPPANIRETVTLERFREVVEGVLGRSLDIERALWLTRFGDAARQAATYRQGRVLLAGDAAHIHPPSGATGVNVALDDAVNLGWKLAAEVAGTAPEGLLDSYHAERHPAGVAVLASTRAQALLGQAGPELEPVAELLTRVFSHPDAGRVLAEAATGLDTRYETHARSPEAHPWVGRMVPDVYARTSGRDTSLSRLLAEGRPVLLGASTGTKSSAEDVTVAEWKGSGAASAVLVRPDGHAIWVRAEDGHESGPLGEALARWCPRD